MKRVGIESPYAGDVALNLRYLHACILDCLRRGEAPFASHGFLTHFLDDQHPAEREIGIEAGLQWARLGDVRAVYTDLGTSSGMLLGIQDAEQHGQPIEYRSIPNWRTDPALPPTTQYQAMSRQRVPLGKMRKGPMPPKPVGDPTQQPIETVPRSGLPDELIGMVGEPKLERQVSTGPGVMPDSSVSDQEIDLMLQQTGGTPRDTY